MAFVHRARPVHGGSDDEAAAKLQGLARARAARKERAALAAERDAAAVKLQASAN